MQDKVEVNVRGMQGMQSVISLLLPPSSVMKMKIFSHISEIPF
jgi:hypothetical protein